MKKVKVKFLPENKIVKVLPGTPLVQAAEETGIIIALPCGGQKTCGMCKVETRKGNFPITKFDRKALNQEELNKGIRLACCANIDTDSEVFVPDTVRLYPKEILSYSPLEKKQFEFSPSISKLTNKKLQLKNKFGIGFDLGTTTIGATLIDLSSGEEISTLQSDNPQSRFGSDIISRLSAIKDKKENLDKLHKNLISKINDLITKFLTKHKFSPNQIIHIVCVGNTFIQHTLTNIYPKGLLEIPFRSEFQKTINKYAQYMKLNLNSKSLITIIPGIGGFIGSDITSAILSSGISTADGVNMVIDLGTNGEIVLAKEGKLTATSCACGPALEGTHISSGIRAISGAIESFTWDKNNFSFAVIDGAEPIGICGTGLIDIIAYLREKNIMKPNGFLEKPAFKITDKINIIQKDIRQFQLAKAAVRAGIIMLLEDQDINIDEIDRVMIAGNFGNFANPDNMIKSTFMPREFQDKIMFIGNAALAGANMVLCSKEALKKTENIADKTKFINLAEDKKFQDKFVSYINFD